jgi:carboxymethylenebutenolidase
MSGPILGFWGDQDVAVGVENVNRLASELVRRGVDFTYRVYPGLGHGFLGESQLDPSSPIYEAARDSWTRSLDFLARHLGSASPSPS